MVITGGVFGARAVLKDQKPIGALPYADQVEASQLSCALTRQRYVVAGFVAYGEDVTDVVVPDSTIVENALSIETCHSNVIISPASGSPPVVQATVWAGFAETTEASTGDTGAMGGFGMLFSLNITSEKGLQTKPSNAATLKK